MGRLQLGHKKRQTFTIRLLPELRQWLKSKPNPNNYIESVLLAQKDLEDKQL